MILLQSSDIELNEQLGKLLSRVEARFAMELQSDLECVNELTDYVEQYRGKMLRPMCLLLAGMATRQGEVDDAHVTLATVVEMVHMSTLVHDDVLDEATMRRRGATINHLEGNESAVMLGDYLISHSYHLCSELNRSDISRRIAAATNTTCEGELLQLANRRRWELDEKTYFTIIERKTAALVGASCELGAMLSDAPPAMCQAMQHFGQSVGVAFQIIDDVLDLTGNPQTVGKTLGLDLGKGKLTLPLIHCLSQLQGTNRQRMMDRLAALAKTGGMADGRTIEPLMAELCANIETHNSLDYAQRRAAERIETAKQQLLAHLPKSQACDMLTAMADAVLTRRF